MRCSDDPVRRFIKLFAQIFQVPTSGGKQNLYFNVVQGPHNNLTLTVEGGGVNATVIQPDIAALNGVVHIIDRVLGVPFTTVRDKLATDPMLKYASLLICNDIIYSRNNLELTQNAMRFDGIRFPVYTIQKIRVWKLYNIYITRHQRITTTL